MPTALCLAIGKGNELAVAKTVQLRNSFVRSDQHLTSMFTIEIASIVTTNRHDPTTCNNRAQQNRKNPAYQFSLANKPSNPSKSVKRSAHNANYKFRDIELNVEKKKTIASFSGSNAVWTKLKLAKVVITYSTCAYESSMREVLQKPCALVKQKIHVMSFSP